MDKSSIKERSNVQKFHSVFEVKNPEEWKLEANLRKHKRWNYSFESLNGYEIIVDGEYDDLRNQIDIIVNNLNEENYFDFIEEIKNIYIASSLFSGEFINENLSEAIKLLEQHSDETNKMENYDRNYDKAVKDLLSYSYTTNLENYGKNLKVFKKLPDDLQSIARLSDRNRKLANAAIVKTLISEDLNDAESSLFELIRQLFFEKQEGKSVLAMIKKEIILYFFSRIAERYSDGHRNFRMEIDMFQVINGITEKLQEINAFIVDNSLNYHSKVFKQYILLNEYKILSILNDDKAYTVLTSQNLASYHDIKRISDDLDGVISVIQKIESGAVVQYNLVKNLEQEIFKDIFLHKTENIAVLQGLINSKINSINYNLVNNSHRMHVRLPKIEKFVEALNNQMRILSRIENEDEFCNKYYLLKKIVKHLDEISEKTMGISRFKEDEGDLSYRTKEQIIEVKRSIENLKNTLKEEDIYHEGFKSFIEAILNFFAELFHLRKKVIFISKDPLPSHTLNSSEWSEHHNDEIGIVS